MRLTSNIPWEAFEQRRNLLQSLLREKKLVLMQSDMRKASTELRSLYPSIETLKSELNVLRRVIAKQGDIDDDQRGERRSRIEYRFASAQAGSPAHTQAEPANGDVLKVGGFAVLWNSLSEVIDGAFREQFVPSAFADSLADGSPKFFLLEHSPPPLASTATGDLTLEATADGLRFEARLDRRDPLIVRAEPLLRARRSMSFAFFAKRDRWTERNGVAIRTVLQADLLEVSSVRTPAYKSSSMQVAERSNWKAEALARERHLKILTR